MPVYNTFYLKKKKFSNNNINVVLVLKLQALKVTLTSVKYPTMILMSVD